MVIGGRAQSLLIIVRANDVWVVRMHTKRSSSRARCGVCVRALPCFILANDSTRDICKLLRVASTKIHDQMKMTHKAMLYVEAL